MSLFRDLTMGTIGGAVGYGMGTKQEKGKVAKLDQPLSSFIEEYARAHGVYNRDNRFYRELLSAAEQYHDPYSD